MTDKKKFKQRVRQRMERTGESYAAARNALARAASDGPNGSAASFDEEERLTSELRTALSAIWVKIKAMERVDRGAIDALGETGHELHQLLAARGHEPRHRKHLMTNRRVPVDTPEFYAHVHSAESLLRFLDVPTANEDPMDITIGHEFEFNVYTRRWGSRDTIHVTRTATGWTFRHMSGPVSTDRNATVDGEPSTGLLRLLDQETLNYPAELPGYFGYLWERAAEEGLDHDAVQKALSSLADWVSEVERRSPGGIFKHYS